MTRNTKILLALLSFVALFPAQTIAQTEPVRVAEIRFTGSRHITNEEFVADIKQQSGGDWQIFDRRRFEYYVNKHSRALLFSKGFFQAKIAGISLRLAGNSYVVTIEVDEGARYRVGKIAIDGVKVFSAEEIIAKMGFSPGDVADGKKFQEFVYETLKQDYADKGHILYDVEFEPEFIKPEAEGLDGTVNIRITIDEGPQFRLGEIHVIGVEKERAGEIKELLGLNNGDIFVRRTFEKGVKKINKTGKYCFIDRDQNVEIRTHEESGTVDLFINVRELPK